MEHLPPLFSRPLSVCSTAETNGFHPLSPRSTSPFATAVSPSTPVNINGLHSGSSGSSSSVSKHHQLEQRLIGGGAQQQAYVGLNGAYNEGGDSGSPHVDMIE